MHLPVSGLVIVTALASSAEALRTAPGSPCSKDCGNVLSSTTSADIECHKDPSSYMQSATGIVLRNCLTCQLGSSYVSSDGQSDLEWLLYNLRYASSSCVFGFPDESKKIYTGPCITRTACEPFENALKWQNLSTTAKPYDYCRLWDEFQFTKCTACLAPDGSYVPANMMTILDAACKQMPADGRTVTVSGQPFVDSLIKAIDPWQAGTFRPDEGPLSLGAKVGIAAAGVVLLLLATGCFIICNGKRRRRAFLRNLEKRQAQGHMGGGFGGIGSSRSRWPGGQGGGGGDMFETPVSQKPLFTSWERSPVSAHTDGFSTGLSPAVEKNSPGGAGPSNFPTRYFSPYSSQFNSPVSGQESVPTQWPQPDGQPQQTGISGGLSPGGWPTSTQEKLLQLAQMEQEREEIYRQQFALHHQQLQQQQQFQQQQQQQQQQPGGLYPQEIGLALGGDDPSLRSKKSAQSMQSYEDQQHKHQYPPPQSQPQPYQSQSPWGFSDVKGKQADHYTNEEYELHEVDSNGSVRVPSGAPMPPVLNHPGYGRYPPPPAPAAIRQQWL